ncbi:hypothetical protein HDG32_003768 [Paraburkholderia sp. CI2]|uniref:hypothetical protein n=1 Tax=Paraburkholderia sp. CI2 TaxID=2723093 RepID=UPI00160949EA|nr:hypothetical protein [Paraburkholderia sp. CI2]MBB5467645.1 hypothetical protein [Paraburkholderia sp. CI2]
MRTQQYSRASQRSIGTNDDRVPTDFMVQSGKNFAARAAGRGLSIVRAMAMDREISGLHPFAHSSSEALWPHRFAGLVRRFNGPTRAMIS